MSAGARTWLVVLLAALAPATACRRSCPTAGPTMTFAHPNGLVLSLPETIDDRGVSVARTAKGFQVRAGEATRYPMHLTVDLRPGVTSPPGAFPKPKNVRGTVIHYRVDEIENPGSGGAEYELHAWEPAHGGHIAYTDHEAPGDDGWGGAPDFCIAWTAIAGTTFGSTR